MRPSSAGRPNSSCCRPRVPLAAPAEVAEHDARLTCCAPSAVFSWRRATQPRRVHIHVCTQKEPQEAARMLGERSITAVLIRNERSGSRRACTAPNLQPGSCNISDSGVADGVCFFSGEASPHSTSGMDSPRARIQCCVQDGVALRTGRPRSRHACEAQGHCMRGRVPAATGRAAVTLTGSDMCMINSPGLVTTFLAAQRSPSARGWAASTQQRPHSVVSADGTVGP